MIIEVISWGATICYIGFTFFLLVSWFRLKYFYPVATTIHEFITVIIPVRNEEENILELLKCLSQQTYPTDKFEILVVDDSSTDNTTSLVNKFILENSLYIKLINVIEGSGKKKAIETAINRCKGELVITIDGDCIAGPDWISRINAYYQRYKPKMICGGVTFWGEQTFFDKMQTIEFASLTGAGAACLSAGYPNMCNGANLTYEKKAFFAVNGFAGNEKIASGDDEFLMHKIASYFPGKVHFLKSSEAIVYTKARKNIEEFVSQRKRWASKWKHYQFRSIKLLAVFIFFYNCLLIITFGFSIVGLYNCRSLFIQIFFKVLIEYIFLGNILYFYRKRINPFIFITTALVYPFYVVIFGVVSRRGSYRWKGRDIRNS